MTSNEADDSTIFARPVSWRDAGWRHDWSTDSGGNVPLAEEILCKRDGECVRLATVCRLPDDTLSLVFSPRDSAIAVDSRDRSRLVKHVVASGAMPFGRFIRCLLPADGLELWGQSLRRHGFRSVGTAVHAEVSPTGGACAVRKVGAVVIREVPGDQRLTGRRRFDVAQLLDWLLRDSADFPQIPRSLGDQILNVWRCLAAPVDIVLAMLDGVAVGLCAYSSDGAVPVSGSITIEYLGVLSEFRRRGIGGQLLRAVLQRSGMRESDSTAAEVFVSYDESNAPAAHLYASAGFVPRSSSSVWILVADQRQHD